MSRVVVRLLLTMVLAMLSQYYLSIAMRLIYFCSQITILVDFYVSFPAGLVMMRYFSIKKSHGFTMIIRWRKEPAVVTLSP